jgi:hypothetical protein
LGVVLQNQRYRNVLKKSTKSVTTALKEILKDPQYRREVTAVLTRKLTANVRMANYVVLFGTEYDLHVKYAKTTMM